MKRDNPTLVQVLHSLSRSSAWAGMRHALRSAGRDGVYRSAFEVGAKSVREPRSLGFKDICNTGQAPYVKVVQTGFLRNGLRQRQAVLIEEREQ